MNEVYSPVKLRAKKEKRDYADEVEVDLDWKKPLGFF
jgi:hypothetical protein